MKRLLVCLVVGVATANLAFGAQECTFDGKFHSAGAIVCHAGKQEKCVAGKWKSLGTSCARHRGHVNPGVHAPTVKHAKSPHQPTQPVQPATHQPPSP